MLTRCTSRRISHLLHLDFLAPAFIYRNQSSSLSSLRPQKRSQKAAQHPSLLATQISQTLTLLDRHEGVIPPSHEIDLLDKTITNLKKALLENDIPGAWKYWSVLADKNLLQFLGPPQLETFSRHVANSYDKPPSDKKWGTLEKDAMVEIALFTAAAGHPEALNAIMLSLVRAEKPDAVLDIYRRYVAKPSTDRTDHEEDDFEPSESDQDPFLHESPIHSISSKTNILLPAISACAMLDLFHEAIHIVLDANIRLDEATVNRLLPTLPNSDKVANYVRRLGIVRILGNPHVLSKHINNIVNDRNDEELEKFYNSIIDGVLGPEPWLSPDKSSHPPRPVTMPDFTWTSLITSFMMCKRPDLAEKLWDDMVKCAVKPQVAVWTAIFDGYGEMGAYQESFGTWDAMISQGIKPEPLTYRAFIATLFKCRRPNDAMDKFREYEREWCSKGKATQSHSPDMNSQILSLHNTVLQGLLTSTDRQHEALDLFKKMQAQGPQPDMVSWNTLLSYYSRGRNLEMLASGLQNMREAGFPGDVYTYSIVLSALLKAGREDAPDVITGMMKKHGIERNTTVNTTIIDQILQIPDMRKLKAAISILTRMESEESVKARPNEVTYTTILSGLYRADCLSKDDLDMYRRDIIRRMRDRDIRPNRTTYHILFKACFDSPSGEGYRYALNHYKGMLRQRIIPNFDTWYILLEGLHKKGQAQIANDMVDEMVEKWYEPSGALRRLIHQIRRGRMNIGT